MNAEVLFLHEGHGDCVRNRADTELNCRAVLDNSRDIGADGFVNIGQNSGSKPGVLRSVSTTAVTCEMWISYSPATLGISLTTSTMTTSAVGRKAFSQPPATG